MNRRDFMTGTLAAGSLSPLLARTALAGAQGAAAGPAPARILVFDTFGTVVDWRSSVIAEGQRLGKAKGLQVDWAAFADAWRGGYGPAMNRVRKGELPWTKLDVLHRMILDDILVTFKVTGLTGDEIAHLNKVWHRLDAWPDASEGLARLKKRYVIAPLSNGNVSLLTDLGKHAALPWDCILSTELVKRYKPDKETYLMAAEFWDVPPSDVMMVAAHDGDLQAAKALGLKTAFVHRPDEFGPAKKPPRPPAGRFDYVAGDFKELATLLGA
jgi:2-haloacid dehalogenase